MVDLPIAFRRMFFVLLRVAAMLWPTHAVAAEWDSRCHQVAQHDYTRLADAPAKITQADGSHANPVFCAVRGYVQPQVGFALFLPLNWNGRLIAVGIGGDAGELNPGLCHPYISENFACITSDFGHQGSGDDGLWAGGNLSAQVDLAYRAAHVIALAGKAITQDFYGRLPVYSYFAGCSGGGTIGLTAAQRFPWDYDGIIVGDPAVLASDWAMAVNWAAALMTDSHGGRILDAAALKTLHAGALAACDRADGIADGVISNPIGCRFDPATLQCGDKVTGPCLNQAQIKAATALYRGPSLGSNERDMPLAWPGSELEWDTIFLMRDYVLSQFTYGVYGLAPGSLSGDYLEDLKRFGVGPFRDASNPDLRRFQARGGKILMYLGAANGVGVSGAALDYYQLVQRVMGNRSADQFFRLFIVPGMDHCGGGAGAWKTDLIGPLRAWVEEGVPPVKLIATHPATATDKQFSRPIYRYPFFAHFQGGKADQASSFVARPARP